MWEMTRPRHEGRGLVPGLPGVMLTSCDLQSYFHVLLFCLMTGTPVSATEVSPRIIRKSTAYSDAMTASIRYVVDVIHFCKPVQTAARTLLLFVELLHFFVMQPRQAPTRTLLIPV